MRNAMFLFDRIPMKIRKVLSDIWKARPTDENDWKNANAHITKTP